MNPITLAFDGISGSGKGTQAELLINFLKSHDPERKIVDFGMGQLLRDYWKEQTSLARRTEILMKDGGLLPAVIPIYVLAAFFNNIDFKGDEHLIIEGAMRRVEQAQAIDELVKFFGRINPTVIIFDLSPQAAYERLKLRGRADDTEEAIKKRSQWFNANALPAVQVLKDLGWSTYHINADQSPEMVHEEVKKALGLI